MYGTTTGTTTCLHLRGHGTFRVIRNCLFLGRYDLARASSPVAHCHVGQWCTKWSPAATNSSGVNTPVSRNFDSYAVTQLIHEQHVPENISTTYLFIHRYIYRSLSLINTLLLSSIPNLIHQVQSDLCMCFEYTSVPTFNTGVKYSATPKAVPLTVFITFCILCLFKSCSYY